MPAFDLPLDELRTYTGRNPRPHDLEEYWAEALDELAGLDVDVRIDPVDHVAPYADCADLWFTGVRGAQVYAKLLQPRGLRAPGPAVLVFHGYSIASPQWFDLLPYVAQGYTVAALDCRGQGGRSQDVGGARGNTLEGHIVRGLGDGPHELAYRHIYLDTVQLARIVMGLPGVDGARVGVTGASQGGGLSLACAALEPRIRAAAPIFPFLSDFQRVWEMDLATDAYVELRDWLRRFDPTHERFTQNFTTLGYIDVAQLSGWIQADVLMATGLMDTICPPSTQFAAYNRITSRKDLVLYPDFEHEALPGHSDRILRWFSEVL